MQIVSTKTELLSLLSDYTSKKLSVGFVPTMGALHQGHMSLIQASKAVCDVTICSIFVNPTQFNDKKDLERYPRTPEQDITLLQANACDVLFMPNTEEMYATSTSRTFDFEYLDTLLEGAHRPGHFNGVAQIVSLFFELINPHKAFFGLKDYQQVMIVKQVVKHLQLPIEIVPCPIEREHDGLAMSSRNRLLSTDERQTASLIPQLMQEAKSLTNQQSIASIKKTIREKINEQPSMKLDYFTFCDADTLLEVDSKSPNKSIVILIAVFVGKIRLIDNILL